MRRACRPPQRRSEVATSARGLLSFVSSSVKIWFADAALGVHARTKQRGVPFTYKADEKAAVGELCTLDWRPLNTIAGERFSRTLGGDEKVIGMGKVEYDTSINKWQPYHHFMVYHPRNWNLFRELRAIPQGRGAQPMAFDEAATWFSDMSELTAFSTLMQQSRGVRQQPLSDRLSREYFGYLASNSPTSFIFCVNCSLVERTVVLNEEEVSIDKGRKKVERRFPGLRPLVSLLPTRRGALRTK